MDLLLADEDGTSLLRARQDLHAALHMLGAAMANVRAAKTAILNENGGNPPEGTHAAAALLIHMEREQELRLAAQAAHDDAILTDAALARTAERARQQRFEQREAGMITAADALFLRLRRRWLGSGMARWRTELERLARRRLRQSLRYERATLMRIATLTARAFAKMRRATAAGLQYRMAGQCCMGGAFFRWSWSARSVIISNAKYHKAGVKAARHWFHKASTGVLRAWRHWGRQRSASKRQRLRSCFLALAGRTSECGAAYLLQRRLDSQADRHRALRQFERAVAVALRAWRRRAFIHRTTGQMAGKHGRGVYRTAWQAVRRHQLVRRSWTAQMLLADGQGKAALLRWAVRERWHEAVLAARRLRKSSNATQRAGQRRRLARGLSGWQRYSSDYAIALMALKGAGVHGMRRGLATWRVVRREALLAKARVKRGLGSWRLANMARAMRTWMRQQRRVAAARHVMQRRTSAASLGAIAAWKAASQAAARSVSLRTRAINRSTGRLETAALLQLQRTCASRAAFRRGAVCWAIRAAGHAFRRWRDVITPDLTDRRALASWTSRALAAAWRLWQLHAAESSRAYG